MNEQKIIEAMARVDGFTNIGKFELKHGDSPVAMFEGHPRLLPHYTTSHDAVQRVIDGLDERELDTYATILSRIISPDQEPYWTPEGVTEILKATALEKCEAILKALGKWTKEME